jgi:hypothetical protein
MDGEVNDISFLKDDATHFATLVIDDAFVGPPGCGNGGYVCGSIAHYSLTPTRVILQAPAPLMTPLSIIRSPEGVRLTTTDGAIIAIASPAEPSDLADTPSPPTYAEAETAGQRFIGFHRSFHPNCLCCRLCEPGDGIRSYAGQIKGHEPGWLAGVWTPHERYADSEGLADHSTIWAALDCPGAVAWVVTQGGSGGWLGTMTCEIVRRPAVGEACILTAWPIFESGRKRLSGTALHTADGDLLATSRQVWLWPKEQ